MWFPFFMSQFKNGTMVLQQEQCIMTLLRILGKRQWWETHIIKSEAINSKSTLGWLEQQHQSEIFMGCSSVVRSERRIIGVWNKGKSTAVPECLRENSNCAIFPHMDLMANYFSFNSKNSSNRKCVSPCYFDLG